MTLCNMAIEMEAKAKGLVAPDETTFAYLKDVNLPLKPPLWDEAVAYWKTLKSDEDTIFDATVTINAAEIAPQVTWGRIRDK